MYKFLNGAVLELEAKVLSAAPVHDTNSQRLQIETDSLHTFTCFQETFRIAGESIYRKAGSPKSTRCDSKARHVGFRGEVLMLCLRSCRSDVPLSTLIPTKTLIRIATAALFSVSIFCLAQGQPQTIAPQTSQTQAANTNSTVTIPAGTQLAMVLTHPVQSRDIHRGDDIYAQIISPVNSGNQMVIPPGVLVQGRVERLVQNHDRGEIHLQAMSITFPDGYVAPVAGPVVLEGNEGYTIKDVSPRRGIAAFVLPAAGAGIGALIGHSIGRSDSQTITTLPPGCVGAPPYCLSTTTPVFGTKARDAIIGAGIGAAVGAVASLTVVFSSHHFFMDVGSPVDMTLARPLTLQQGEVDSAVQQSAQHPIAQQFVAPRPVPPPFQPGTAGNNGTCYTPGTQGTPPTTIPGAPGPDGIPGPPTIIPGTPPTPGMPYPCP